MAVSEGYNVDMYNCFQQWLKKWTTPLEIMTYDKEITLRSYQVPIIIKKKKLYFVQ